MKPIGTYRHLLFSAPILGLVATSHHLSLSDKLNGYCLHFFTCPKAFNK